MTMLNNTRRFRGAAAAIAIAAIVGGVALPLTSAKADPFVGVDLGGVAIGIGTPGPHYYAPPYYGYRYGPGYYGYYGPGPYYGYYPW